MYNILAPTDSVEKTVAAVQARGIEVTLVAHRAHALQRLTDLLPSGASLMTAASITLKEIGFEALLKDGSHSWKNLKDAILAEQDLDAQRRLRQKATLADYTVGSVQAIAETGEIVVASGSGSQLPGYVYSSNNVIWVAGVQKIVPTLDAALRRVREYSLPMEDARMKSIGRAGSHLNKIVIFERESPSPVRKVHLILVNEVVGV